MDALLTPAMNPAVNPAQNIQNQRSRMESLGKRKGTPEEERAKMQSACEGFEALFIQKIWDEMRSSLPKDGMMHSKEEEQWQGMYSQELGKSMAKSGGIGLADMMMVQLTKNRDDLADASAKAAPRQVGMAVPPVPLLPEVPREKVKAQPAEDDKARKQQAQQEKQAGISLHDLYEGEALQPDGEPLPEENSLAQTEAASDMANLSTVAMAGNFGPAPAEEGSAVVRQTLDELRSQLLAQGLEVPGMNPGEPQPVVQTFTYTTNLPPSQRQGMEKILAAARQNEPVSVPQVPASARSLNQPRPEPANAEPEPIPAQVLSKTEEKTQAPAPRQPGVPAPEDDILAGITVSYRPEIRQAAPATLFAALPQPEGQRLPTQGIVEEKILAEAAPKRSAAQMPETAKRSSGPRPLSTEWNYPAPGALLAANESFAPQANPQDPALAARLRPVRAGGPALTSPLSAPEQQRISTADLGRLNLEAGSVKAPIAGEISSGFGWRLDPLSGQRTWHNGVDIRAEAGAPVRASLPGRVSFAGQDAELGNLVIVDHPGGLQSYYGHNEKIQVQVGDSVNEGTEIASAGSSGRASGTHVHFELRRNNLPLNPEPVLARGAAAAAPLIAAR